MTDQMTRLQQEAEMRYPLDRRQVMFGGEPFPRPERAAFIAGRTISAEQMEQAAAAANGVICQQARGGDVDIEVFSDGLGFEHAITRAALEAAGMVIEDSAE